MKVRQYYIYVKNSEAAVDTDRGPRAAI